MFGLGSNPHAKVIKLDTHWLASLNVDGLIVSSADISQTLTTQYFYAAIVPGPSQLPADASYIAKYRLVTFNLVFDEHPEGPRQYKILAAIEANVPTARR